MSKLLSILVAGLFAGGAIAGNTTTHGPGHGSDHASGKYGANTCPPGLAKKDNGCMPPGQVGKDTSRMGNSGRTDRDHMHRDVKRRDGMQRDRDGMHRDRDGRK